MNKEQKIIAFDPNGVGDLNANIYGLPFNSEEAEIVLLPVPWEVTVSYGGGTLEGPEAILEASYQVDLHDPMIPDAWKLGISMEEVDQEMKNESLHLRAKAEQIIEFLSSGQTLEQNPSLAKDQSKINQACAKMNAKVKERCLYFLKKEKTVGLVGGDHSTPLGMMQALSEIYPSFGILQIDAHADLRVAYEGFEFSHASIMYNALKIPAIKRLVQVGIRDYCKQEFDLIQESEGRVITYFDRDIKHQQYNGQTWAQQCEEIIHDLPEHVYLSFDIDGLDPKLCPNTGTPVAGGFEAEQVLFLLEHLVKAGKKIIAFDLNEVAPGEEGDWDANVAARLLYRIANLAAYSNGKRP